MTDTGVLPFTAAKRRQTVAPRALPNGMKISKIAVIPLLQRRGGCDD
jgi:hypothetical protein